MTELASRHMNFIDLCSVAWGDENGNNKEIQSGFDQTKNVIIRILPGTNPQYYTVWYSKHSSRCGIPRCISVSNCFYKVHFLPVGDSSEAVSIRYLSPCFLCRVAGGWSPSQRSLVKRRGTSIIGHLFNTGLVCRDKQLYTLIFRPAGQFRVTC